MNAKRFVVVSLALSLVTIGSASALDNLLFVPLTPCRVVNTTLAGGIMQVGVPRTFVFGAATTNYGAQGGATGGCGVPGISTASGDKFNLARAVAINVTVSGATANGHFRAWPANLALPTASVINYGAVNGSLASTSLANAIVLPMCTTEAVGTPCSTGDITFQAFVSNAHLIVDVVGYLTAGSSAPAAPNNVASGRKALDSATTGDQNVAIGRDALTDNQTGSGNVAIGDGALANHVDQDGSIAIGRNALFDDVDGSGNVAIGDLALENNTFGVGNVAVGKQTLQQNVGGTNSVAIGAFAANSLVGNSNTVVGNGALAQLPMGDFNIAIGADAGFNVTGFSNGAIWIGHPGVVGDSNRIRIGTVQASTFIAGIRGIAVTGGQTVLIDANGQLGSVSSSLRGKQDITPVGEASAAVYALRPVAFRYKEQVSRGDDELQYGLIAEEVAETFPELATYDAAGRPDGVRYHLLVPLLLNELQRVKGELAPVQRQLDALESLVHSQREENRALRHAVSRLEAQRTGVRAASGN
jgi:hypothetical protein